MTVPRTPAYFISDLHLDAVFRKNNPQHRKLDDFFDHLRQEAGSLYILGDYFDFWFEYGHVVPSRSLYGLHKLMTLREHDVDVVYLTGNHDGWARRFFQEEFNIPVYHGPVTVDCPPHRVLLLHGDGLRSGESGYRLLRWFIRHPLNQWLYRKLHPGLGIPLARWFSRKSRERGPESFDESKDPAMNQFYDDWFARGIDVIMMGHNHRPSSRNIGEKKVMVLGDWIRHFSYAVYNGSSVQLLEWKKK